MHTEEPYKKRLFGNEGTLGLFVALYLILLTFFILLNSMSQHAAERASAAVESVNSTFYLPRKLENLPTIVPSAEEVAGRDQVLSAVRRAFLAKLKLEGRFATSGGNTFEVQFPADTLFLRGTFLVRPEMTGFLDELIKAVRAAPASRQQQVAILFGGGTGTVAREMTRAQEVAVRRAGALARYLRMKGIADGVFTTGFTAIPEGEILAAFWSAPAAVRGGAL